MLKQVQGFEFKIKVEKLSSILVIKSDDTKIVLNNPQEIDGKLYIIASKETTSKWKNGVYKYQIINDDFIEASGHIEIQKNFLLTDEYETVKSHNELMLDAINAQIERTSNNSTAINDSW